MSNPPPPPPPTTTFTPTLPTSISTTPNTQMGLNRVVERDKRFNMSLKATCRVCSLYRREYACFGYAFPPGDTPHDFL